jgi:ADP-heptose:LPS heptosyltransferase
VLREKAFKENDKLMMSGAIVDRKELETVVNSYMEDTMRLGNSLMSPDILYDNRMEMAKAFHEGSAFLDSVEESNSPSNEGCSSCRLNRIKKEMYEAFIKDVHTLDDDKKIEVLNHWAVILPTVTTLRIVEKLKYHNIGRHELVPAKYKAMKRIVMDVQMAIGDVMAATAAVKTLKRVDPSYKVWVESSCPELWANNPLIERTPIPADAVRYVMGATLSEQVKSKNSFIQEYWKALHVQLFGTDVDFNVAEPSPDLYLDRREKLPKYVQGKFGVKKPYWIVVCGYKSDHPLKHWGAPESGEFYQKVVDATPHINWVQMGKTGDDHHTHIQLRGVTSLLGLTNNNMRDMLALVYNAEGVLCPNTCYQHIAAAFPHVRCMTIGGAREPEHWLDYGKSNQLHRYVNTIGKLPCSSDMMCKEPGTHFKNECSNKGESGAPMCMEMITPDEIVELISKLT